MTVSRKAIYVMLMYNISGIKLIFLRYSQGGNESITVHELKYRLALIIIVFHVINVAGFA
jgi:hypothetical protein